MTSILGPYWSPWHRYKQDEDYMEALDPAWVLIHQPQARDVATAQRLAPNAKIMLRSWDIDDSDGARKQEMYNDPKGAAHKHLQMWKDKWNQIVDEMHKNGWSYDESRWYIQLVNEPDPAHVPQVVTYSQEAMRIVQGTQIRMGVVVSSVGCFSKPSENGNGWALCTPLEQPINDGGHILVVHEYWQPEGPSYGEDAGNLAWRHHSIPLNVPILVGESGANGYIYGRYSKEDNAGWGTTVKDPNVYAAQVKEYIAGCDERVVGVLLYMLDYHSDQWESFYTGPAAQQLLAIKDTRPQAQSPYAKIATKPVDTHIPSISVPPTQPEPPTGDNWSRAWPIVLDIEGGLSTDRNDPGNYRPDGTFVGTKFGISALAHPDVDIVNLTKEQALAIYKRDYWDASGANNLEWPLSLAVFDLAVNGGVGRAQQALNEAGHDFDKYNAWRLRWYTRLDQFKDYGPAWVRRVATIMEAA